MQTGLAPTPTPPPAQPPAASLLPREHGAYGQLAMPLLTGLALARPSAAAFALAAAFVLAFVAHEPMLVVLGQRGKRLRTEEGARAARLLAWLAGLAAVAGAVGIVLAPPAARVALLAPAALGVGVLLLVWRRLEKTAAGELAVAAALSSCGAVVALAAGVPPGVAFAAFATWILAFGAAIAAVRAILLLLKTKGARDLRALAAALAIAILGGAWAVAERTALPHAVAVALVPMVAASVALCAIHVPARRLKTVGWAIVAASTLTLVLLVVGLR